MQLKARPHHLPQSYWQLPLILVLGLTTTAAALHSQLDSEVIDRCMELHHFRLVRLRFVGVGIRGSAAGGRLSRWMRCPQPLRPRTTPPLLVQASALSRLNSLVLDVLLGGGGTWPGLLFR